MQKNLAGSTGYENVV
ncbi:hypothetical protein CC1_22530 [Coprococcus catus GD/7]|uniref:Uncharacterized protein n=1 Tax=Coprococcus catus GD/7 TaxID=717962 RepID=D4J9B5_9FIRM|nr:hypothetical protein CC1_22530 [Coprococcus catus GD/7]